jgi:hypothetical protein
MNEAYLLADGLLDKGDYQSTLRVCKDALSGDIADSLTRYALQMLLASALSSLGQAEEACVLCSEVLLWARSPSARRDYTPVQLANLCILAMLELLGLAIGYGEHTWTDFQSAADEAEPLVSAHGGPDGIATLLMLRGMADPRGTIEPLQEAAAVRGVSDRVKVSIGMALTSKGGGQQAIEMLRLDPPDLPKPLRMARLMALATELVESSPPQLTEALDYVRRAAREAASTDSPWFRIWAETMHADIAMECDARREALEALANTGDILLAEPDSLAGVREAIIGRLADIASKSWQRGAKGAHSFSDAFFAILRRLDTPHSQKMIEWLEAELPPAAREPAPLSPGAELGGLLSRAKDAVGSLLHYPRRKSS